MSGQRQYYIGLAVFIVLLSFTFFLFHEDDGVVYDKYDKVAKVPYRCPSWTEVSSKPDLRAALSAVFSSLKHDPTNPEYIDTQGQSFFANQTIWTQPFGKKLLIVDIDTRVPTDTNQILNPSPLDFQHMSMSGGGLVSNAIINHYTYALIHGYDYKYYQAASIPDHHDTWILPHTFRELIADYQFVVGMDADVTIPHMEVPLEWMFNRWGIQKHTSMALPWDTMELRDGKPISVDSKGLRVLNTGFVVAQDSEITRDLLEKWRDCTSEERYEGCAQWKTSWSHEQRAFSEYIRYDYNITPQTIVSIDCDDAVGWPGFKKDVEGGNAGISDCSGNFVRHYTLGKDQVREAGMLSIMNPLAQILQSQLLRNQNTMWVQEIREEDEQKEEEEGQSEVREGHEGKDREEEEKEEQKNDEEEKNEEEEKNKEEEKKKEEEEKDKEREERVKRITERTYHLPQSA